LIDLIESLRAALDGRYAVERLIGQGGMATVYLARACDGTLYGVELTAASTQRLVTIDLITGAATVVATLNVDAGRVGSILFTQSGTLVGSSSGGPHADMLFDINPSTGAVSNIRGTSFNQGLGAARTCDIIP